MDREALPLSEAEEIVALFEKAESRIKILELLHDEGLFFHPVNQLRYAGFHIVNALKTTDIDEEIEQWKRAKRHCQRAVYDASEMALVYCLSEIEGFKNDYKSVDISPTVDNYLDIVSMARNGQELLESVDHEHREEKYQECDDMFDELKPHVDRLNDARPELNKRLKNQRRNLFFLGSGLIIAILGLLLA